MNGTLPFNIKDPLRGGEMGEKEKGGERGDGGEEPTTYPLPLQKKNRREWKNRFEKTYLSFGSICFSFVFIYHIYHIYCGLLVIFSAKGSVAVLRPPPHIAGETSKGLLEEERREGPPIHTHNRHNLIHPGGGTPKWCGRGKKLQVSFASKRMGGR